MKEKDKQLIKDFISHMQKRPPDMPEFWWRMKYKQNEHISEEEKHAIQTYLNEKER